MSATGDFESHRCLVIVPTLARGGAERQAVLVSLALRSQGYEVLLFVQSGEQSLRTDGVTGTLPLDLPRLAESLPAQLLRLRRATERFVPDAVITFMRGATGRFALTRATSAVARRAAWIATARGNTVFSHARESPVAFAAGAHWYRGTDRVVTPSSSLAGNLFAFDASLANKVLVIPNVTTAFPVDPTVARARVDSLIGGAQGRPILGCLGSFQEDRNYTLLADAFGLVLRSHPSAHVLIIGRTTGSAYSRTAGNFRLRVRELGIGQHVTLAGEVPNARELLPGLDVFLMPSRLEGSSNALAEAMIAGVPTATTPVADASELVGNAAIVSRGWTPSAFADAILVALGKLSSLQKRAAAQGQTLLSERSSERVGIQWARLVAEAVSERRWSERRP